MTEPTLTKNTNLNSEQLASFNSFIDVEVEGEIIRVQITTRHGIPSETVFSDFQQHIEALKMVRGANPAPARNPAPAGLVAQAQALAQGQPQQSAPQQGGNTRLSKIKVNEVKKQVTTNGKEHLKVYGGNFAKFGVTCWPEVSEGFFGLDAMEIGKAYAPPATAAYAIVQEELDASTGKWKVQKVTAFSDNDLT